MTEESRAAKAVRRSSIAKCPFLILQAEHYRDDGTCRCDDPDHEKMREWGYEWDGSCWRSKEER